MTSPGKPGYAGDMVRLVLDTDVLVSGQAAAIITYNRRDFAGIGAFGIETLSPWQLLKLLGRNPRQP